MKKRVNPMNKRRNVLLCFICCLLMSDQTFAYIDPATGSLIIHGAIAALVGALAIIKFQFARVKAFFNKILGRKMETPEGEENPNLPETEIDQKD